MTKLWSWLNRPTGEWSRLRYLVDAFFSFLCMVFLCFIIAASVPEGFRPFIMVVVANWFYFTLFHHMYFDSLSRACKNPSDHSEG